MRPVLDKQKQDPRKKAPGMRAPTLQIELELPRLPEEELQRPPTPEPADRGVSIVDFYI
jgi:hypothetical protein